MLTSLDQCGRPGRQDRGLRQVQASRFRNAAARAGIVIGALATIGLITAGVMAGVAAKNLVDTCRDLGPGQHVVHGVTYTCG